MPSFERAIDNPPQRSSGQRVSVPGTTRAGVRIHPTAVVDSTAVLGVDVEIGPYAIVEAGARIGDRTRIIASAFVAEQAEIGEDCELHCRCRRRSASANAWAAVGRRRY